jgi:hypothetical protein
MHMCDICCVESICGSIFGDYSVIFFALLDKSCSLPL